MKANLIKNLISAKVKTLKVVYARIFFNILGLYKPFKLKRLLLCQTLFFVFVFFLHPFQIKDRVLDSKRYVYTAQKMKFSIQDFFSKCDQIHKYKAINKGSGVEKKTISTLRHYQMVLWTR